MYNQHHEIEAIVEDLIENTILECFANSFKTKKECLIGLEILLNKLEELDTDKFDEILDE